MSDSVDPATDHVLLALAAIAILVVTAPFLLTATVDVPAGSATGPDVDPSGSVAEDLQSAGPDGESQLSEGAAAGQTATGDGTDLDPEDVDVHVDASETGGHLVPGRIVTISVTVEDDPAADVPVTVGIASVGETNESGVVTATVPGTDTTTVEASVGGVTVERTLDVAGPMAVEVVDTISRANGTTVQTTVEGHAVPGATVTANAGDGVETDEQGLATVDVPERADALSVSAVYGELLAERHVDLSLDVALDSRFPAAGSTAGLSASYDDRPADVDVYLFAGEPSRSHDQIVAEDEPTAALTDGEAAVRLPAASSVTIVADDGHQTAAASLDGLLRNLAIGIVLVLSITGGVVLTTLRVLRWMEIDRASSDSQSASVLDVLADFGAAIAGLAASIGAALDRLAVPRVRLPSLPPLSFGLALPSLSAPRWSPSLPTLSLPSLSVPTLGTPSIGLPSLSVGSESDAEDDVQVFSGAEAETADPFAADEDDETAPTLSERELVRAAVRDLGRLSEVRRIETRTPGQIGRRAKERSFPHEPVETIVRSVRSVEYAGKAATRDQAARVKRAVRRLRDAAAADGGEDE